MTTEAQKLLGDARRAKARLTDIKTQEVSLVDNGANLRRFVIVKRNDMTQTTTAKVALRLPTEAKQGIMDGLGQMLDKLTALATMVGDAETDDAAVVPPDLGLALRQCGEMCIAIADQYSPAAEPAPEAAPPDAEPAAMAAPPPAAAPGEVGKALPPAQADPLTLAAQKDPLTMAPKTMQAAADLFKAMGDEIADVAKAGRKISGGRFKKLSELHDALGKLLNELSYDDAAAAAGLLGEDAPPAKKAAGADVAKQLADLRAQVASQQETIAKFNRAPADAPRARPAGEGGGAPSAVRWPTDMSADLHNRRAGRR